MRITAVDTVQVEAWPHLIWVRVHTDEGLIGLGETSYHTEAVAGYIHQVAAPYLVGKDPTRIDLHSRTLLKSLMALEEFEPYWLEDPVKMDNVTVLKEYADSTRLTVCGSETFGTRADFREVIERHAVGIVMFDTSWVGGISEARKIAAMAETHHLPVAPHDATGPVTLISGNHVVMNAPNGLIQELVRSYYATWYRDIVTEMPLLKNGVMYPLTGSGLGTKLQPDLLKRKDTRIRTTKAS